jgi:hypothetical protein
LNRDGTPATPYQPQESCWLIAFERSIGLQGAELPLAFDADEAASSCGSMFFPMQELFACCVLKVVSHVWLSLQVGP